METEYKVGDRVNCRFNFCGSEEIADGTIIVIRYKWFFKEYLIKKDHSKFADWISRNRIIKKYESA
jgi:hypothetical protein